MERAESVIITGTSAVDIGGSAAASDTSLVAIRIYANGGGAVTATITGLPPQQDGATAVSRVLTGSTTLDLTFEFYGVLNTKAKLAITPSVTNKVEVFYNKSFPPVR